MQNRFILTIFLMMFFLIRATYSNAQNQSVPITNKTVNNILYDYKNNKISYFSKEHPKSFGLNVEIEYPKDWLVAEGKRPHIVQKFIERNHKAECMLLIQKVPEILSQSEWKIEWDYLAYYDDAKKEFIKEHNINGNLNVISTQYEAQPGIMLEYATSGSRAGSNFFSETIQHLFGYKNMMICLQCYVVGNTIDDAKKNMITYAPLFKAMGNDIILHNIYTDEYNLENNTHNISSNYDFDINKLYKKEVLLSNKVNEDTSKTMDDFFER